MDIGAAQIFRRHHLAGRRLHQRRAAEKNRALIAHDDGFVGHGGNIGAAGRAGAHHHRDLGNALGRHIGLIEENAAEMIAVGKDLVLHGQEGAAGIDQIDAGQVVLLGDFLRAQMLFHGQRIIGSALHRGVIGDDHALDARDAADACDDAGARRVVAIKAMGGELADFEKSRAGIEQGVDALARQKLAARLVPRRRDCRRRPAARLSNFVAQIRRPARASRRDWRRNSGRAC